MIKKCIIMLILVMFLYPVYASTKHQRVESHQHAAVKQHAAKKHSKRYVNPAETIKKSYATNISNSSLIKVLKKFNVPEHKQGTIMRAIRSASHKHKVGSMLIVAIIAKESSFKQNVTSRAGAKGLMQVMPVHRIKNPFNIDSNIEAGTLILASYVKEKGIIKGIVRYGNGRSYVNQLMASVNTVSLM